MKLMGLTVGLFLSGSLIAAAQAAPVPAAAKETTKPGLKNAKKVMVAKQQRDDKTRAVRKQGIAARQQAMTKKGVTQ
jgi:hypothetical protein